MAHTCASHTAHLIHSPNARRLGFHSNTRTYEQRRLRTDDVRKRRTVQGRTAAPDVESLVVLCRMQEPA